MSYTWWSQLKYLVNYDSGKQKQISNPRGAAYLPVKEIKVSSNVGMRGKDLARHLFAYEYWKK